MFKAIVLAGAATLALSADVPSPSIAVSAGLGRRIPRRVSRSTSHGRLA